MASKRMFSKSITNSSRFLMMPQSSQNLYFHLGMNADDDGYCEHFSIMRMTDSKPDDLNILKAKRFVEVFDDHVLIILDWKENNLIRSDRYTPSKYLEIYKSELKKIESGIPEDNQRLPQVRLGKVRLGKVNKYIDQNDETIKTKFNLWYDLYNKKVGKEAALKEFIKLNPDDQLFQMIIDRTKLYIESKPDKTFRKDPERFIKYKIWNDEIIKYQSKEEIEKERVEKEFQEFLNGQ